MVGSDISPELRQVNYAEAAVIPREERTNILIISHNPKAAEATKIYIEGRAALEGDVNRPTVISNTQEAVAGQASQITPQSGPDLVILRWGERAELDEEKGYVDTLNQVGEAEQRAGRRVKVVILSEKPKAEIEQSIKNILQAKESKSMPNSVGFSKEQDFLKNENQQPKESVISKISRQKMGKLARQPSEPFVVATGRPPENSMTSPIIRPLAGAGGTPRPPIIQPLRRP